MIIFPRGGGQTSLWYKHRIYRVVFNSTLTPLRCSPASSSLPASSYIAIQHSFSSMAHTLELLLSAASKPVDDNWKPLLLFLQASLKISVGSGKQLCGAQRLATQKHWSNQWSSFSLRTNPVFSILALVLHTTFSRLKSAKLEAFLHAYQGQHWFHCPLSVHSELNLRGVPL